MRGVNGRETANQPQKKTTLAKEIDKLVRTGAFRSRREIATAINMNDSGFSRAQDDGTLTVEQCLRLAALLKRDPGGIFRLVKRDDLADIASVAFRVSEEKPSALEEELLKKWRQITEAEQSSIETLLDGLIAARPARGTTRTARMKRLAARLNRHDAAIKAENARLRRAR